MTDLKQDEMDGEHVEFERIIAIYGFDKCEWTPEESCWCEDCGEYWKQLYFAGPTDAGAYLCGDCIVKMHAKNEDYEKSLSMEEQRRIEEIVADGHTNHCACRQVWGDGECECKMKGIIPGTISRMICAV